MEHRFDKDKFRVLFYKTGWTNAELGFRIGRSAGAVSQYKSGYTNPSEATIQRMAEVFHCTVDDLLEGEVEKPIEAEKPTSYTAEEKEAVAFESLMTAIELIKIARDMLGELRKGEER